MIADVITLLSNATLYKPSVENLMPFPVEPKWIAETERKLGVRFPSSFVVAMARMNGGSVVTGIDQFELYSFLDQTDRKRIRRTCSSICRETKANRDWDHFPQDLVVIGHNGGGDLLVLAPMKDDPNTLQHTVYWYDHETSRIAPVALDFSDLAMDANA